MQKKTSSELTLAFPVELREARQWVIWRREARDPTDPESEIAKVPYQASTGRTALRARVDDSRTWVEFDTAARAYEQGDDVDGIGFVFTEGDPWAFIDLDACLGNVTWGEGYVDWLLDEVFETWAERSQSGTGLHLIVLGKPALDRKVGKGRVEDTVQPRCHEVYGRKRFVALTGDVVRQAPIAARSAEVERLSGVLDAYKHVLFVLNKEENSDLAAVWLDSGASGEGDRSKDDFRLACWLAKLAHGDEAVCEWLMRLSGRWREKWESNRRSSNEDDHGVISQRWDAHARLTYLEMTVGRACREWRKSHAQVEATIAELGDASRVLATAPMTDAGDTECFVAMFGDEVRYNKTNEQWMVWDGNAWRTDARNGDVWSRILRMVRARGAVATSLGEDEAKAMAVWSLRGESTAHMAAIETQLKRQLAVEVTQFDQDGWLVGVQNGMVDLRTGEFRHAAPGDWVSKQLGAAYDATARCPRWERFLLEIFDGDAEMVRYIQRAVGYSLVEDADEQALFLCVGNGANGKSLMLNTLGKLFGEYTGHAAFGAFDADHSGPSEEIARLRGVRLLLVIESNEDRRLDEAKVKSITGGDVVTAHYKYGHVFDYLPQFTPWLAMNREPRIVGTDKGIWRRIRKIPFSVTFEGDVADKRLHQKLDAELAGILNWALAGLRAWQAEGLGTTAVVERVTEEYREQNDTVREWAHEMLLEGDDKSCAATMLYGAFRAWQRARGEREMTMTSWGRRMAELGYKKQKGGMRRGKDGRNTWYYMSIELDDDALAAMNQYN